MALNLEPIVQDIKTDTRDFEKGMDRAAGKTREFADESKRMSDRFGNASQAMARDSLGLVRSVDAFTRSGGNMSDKIGSLVFDMSQMSQSLGKLGGALGSTLAFVGTVAPWIALAAAVGTVAIALADMIGGLSEAQKEFKRLEPEMKKFFAATPVTFLQRPTAMAEEAPPGFLAQPRGAAGARAKRARTATAESTQALAEAEAQANAIFEASWQQMLDERGAHFAFIREQEVASYDERKAIMEQKGRELIEGFQEQLREAGVEDPQLGLSGLWIGDVRAIEERLAEFDIVAAKMQTTMKDLGNITKNSAAAGFQAMFASIQAGKGAKAVFGDFAKAMINAIAQAALVKTAFELAEGFAALARYDFPSASSHFTASAIYGGIGATAAVAGAALGGGGGRGGGRGTAAGAGPIGGTTAGGGMTERELQPIIIRVDVPPGGQVAAGQGVIEAVEAYERERGRRTFSREA